MKVSMSWLVRFLVASLLLAGCTNTETVWIDMSEKTNSGLPDESITLFQDAFKSYEDADTIALAILCSNYLILHRFGDLRNCMTQLEQLSKTGTVDNKQFYLFKRAEMEIELGQHDKALSSIQKSLDYQEPGFGIIFWEMQGMLVARNGDHAQATKLIEKINRFRLTIFFGLITLAEDSIGKMRRDGIARIYLEMGEYAAARKEIAKKLPGQSISEWLLNNAFNYVGQDLDSDVVSAIETVQDLQAKENTDSGYLDLVITLFLIGNVAYFDGKNAEAIQSYRRLIALKKVDRQRFVYLTALHRLGVVYKRAGAKSAAKRYLSQAVVEIEKSLSTINDPASRISFLADRMSAYTDLIAASDAAQRAAVCERFTRVSPPGLTLKVCAGA